MSDINKELPVHRDHRHALNALEQIGAFAATARALGASDLDILRASAFGLTRDGLLLLLDHMRSTLEAEADLEAMEDPTP